MSEPEPFDSQDVVPTELAVAGKGVHVFIFALTTVVVVLVLALILTAIGRASAVEEGPVTVADRVNVLANSDDDCVVCHANVSPGIIEQFGRSSMAAAGVECLDCHEVEEDNSLAVAHEGTFVMTEPTPAICGDCHAVETAEFQASRHGLPAYVAYAGTDPLNEQHQAMYAAIPEAGPMDRVRQALYHLEGEAITEFACETCHDIGRPNADGSVGQCNECHQRHFFSLEQVRKPETCNACHIGPDHPQYEIYIESAHGIAYHTMGHAWNWEARPGTQESDDIQAATCAVCHMSGFGSTGTTHDIGDRLTWYLFAEVSTRRPAWQDNQVRMRNVCRACHNETFIGDFYERADACTESVNHFIRHSQAIQAPLLERGLLTDAPFDEPWDYEYFDCWHHWGRTAKFGAWMSGADYTQWHGIYELMASQAHLREIAWEKLERAGVDDPESLIPERYIPGETTPDGQPIGEDE